ncbi:hypothetical protein [Bdellovibrio sp. HCB2-146]|uniref:hypothetical protein n=1 Tax=Bdellovibrio sp. HCB2-146 TaxID=3394362 RepID=UPI0039BD4871
MIKRLNRKFSGFLILAVVLSAVSGIAKNRWQARMEKEANTGQQTQTQTSSSGSGGMVVGESDVNCMNVKVRLGTNILAESASVSEVPVRELKNGAGASFACTAFAPPLHGNGQPVTAGNVNVVCSGGKLTVTSSNCALQPKDCPASSAPIPAGIQAGTAAANVPTPAIAHGGSTSVACTSASPGLVIDGKAVDRGTIAVSCNNGTVSYAGSNSCAVPPPCPAGSCYAACNSWCTDGTGTDSWTSNCVTGGKGGNQICTSNVSTYRSCQNGQYYRNITSTRSGTTTSTGWACSSSTRQ